MATAPRNAPKKKSNQGMTATQLFARTTQDRIERARHVKLLKTKIGHDADGNGFVAAQTTTVRKIDDKGRLVTVRNGPKYVTVITFFDRQLHCRISCSCDDNLFRWEVSNTRRKASEIEYSNGDLPVVTNPKLNPGMCKHIAALYQSIKSRLPK